MSCKDCGNKKSRHDIKSAPLAQSMEEAKEVVSQGSFNQPMADPMAAFIETKKLSYEEITERRLMQQRMLVKQAEAMYSEMTEAMRRVHVDELVSVANNDKFSIPGMTSEQAVVGLFDILQKPEFHFISDIYPGLREEVVKRYNQMRENRLPGPKNG